MRSVSALQRTSRTTENQANLRMSKKSNQDVKRQLFKGLASRKSSNLDAATSNLLSRTLRKNSDKYMNKAQEDREFVIHKSTRPEDYEVFSTSHPIRESKLQAFEQSEQAFNEVLHSGFDDSGSEDEEPDVSSIASPSALHEDDILISVPGYSKEELTASKRLNVNDRRDVRLSKVSSLERAFTSTDFLKGLSPGLLHEYDRINQEFNSDIILLQEERELARKIPSLLPKEECQSLGSEDIKIFRDLVAQLDEDSWMYPSHDNNTMK